MLALSDFTFKIKLTLYREGNRRVPSLADPAFALHRDRSSLFPFLTEKGKKANLSSNERKNPGSDHAANITEAQ